MNRLQILSTFVDENVRALWLSGVYLHDYIDELYAIRIEGPEACPHIVRI